MKTAIALFCCLLLAFLFSGLAQGFIDGRPWAFVLAPVQALAGFATATVALLFYRRLAGCMPANAPRSATGRKRPTNPAARAPETAASPVGIAAGDRQHGTVKWFSPKKGFGFISSDDGQEVFVHYRNIQGNGRRGLRQGQRVHFHRVNSDRGLQAEDVHADD